MTTKSVLFYYIMISGTNYIDFFITENDIKKSFSMSTDTSLKELK